MRHPPYHLRVNKAVDRAALVEAIGILANGQPLSNYRYYGMGGPFLEEHRLLYEAYPQLKLVSIEEDQDTYRRQQFHRPCSEEALDLRRQNFKSFLRTYEPQDEKSIVWADYTDLKYEHVDSFIALLQKVALGSMVKVTLRSDAKSYKSKEAQKTFRKEFDAVLPGSVVIPIQSLQFATMLQRIMQTAAQQAFHGIQDREFQLVSSLYYRDSVGMYTLTGVLCSTANMASTRTRFESWRFANLEWAPPTPVDLPELTTKERHHLQEMLPCEENAGEKLQRRLGYLIDDKAKSMEKLHQWALYHRYAINFP